MTRRLAWCLAVALAVPTSAALAAPDDHHDHDKDRDRYPREAPPPPKTERVEVKVGSVWLAGRWDWNKDKKWMWVPGHLEAEHAGKKWTEPRWEHRGDHWELVEGTWIDAGGAAPPTTGVVVSHDNIHPHHDWKLDMPVVSNYWPAKGKAGTKVVIRGKNFPGDATVEYGGRPLADVKVDADHITARIPADAPTAVGNLVINVGRHKIMVGGFEVANYDADAEAKQIAADQQKAAQAAWAAQQGQLAADRAARQAAYDKRLAEYDTSRDQRREQREAEIRAKFESAFLADADTQAELTLHAQRVAKIQRMKDLIEVDADAKLGVRIEVIEKKENDRHDARMAALLANFKANGGAK
nr:IPT/TIG domain-containing protein [Kofleriaceae bacterium]